MSAEIVVSLISAAVALLSIGISAFAARGTLRLQSELEERRRLATKEELLEEVMGRYREPLLRAAFDLQSRLYNIVKQGFLRKYLRDGLPAHREYARNNTLFVLAEYLGWVEILRRGVQFLDLGDVGRNRQLVEKLDAISTKFLTDKDIADPTFRLFRGEQRAIGELMIDPRPPGTEDDIDQCIGYAAFTAKLTQEKEFARWFAQLDKDVDALAHDPNPVYDRPVELQGALIGLIDFLDDPPVRFPKHQRIRLARANPLS